MGRNVRQTEAERQDLPAFSPDESGWGTERSVRRHDQAHLDDHGHAYYSHDAEDVEELHPADAEHPAATETVEEDTGQSPDDPLGLYLRQMGAIPLLNRKEELELSQRLEKARLRYRHAALLSWQVLDQVVGTFERVLAGQLAVDPTIDVVTSLNLSREQILKRMPFNVRTLRHLLTEVGWKTRLNLIGTSAADLRSTGQIAYSCRRVHQCRQSCTLRNTTRRSPDTLLSPSMIRLGSFHGYSIWTRPKVSSVQSSEQLLSKDRHDLSARFERI